jgi:D-hydroxyproline dehydrogenase subunit beta
VTPTSRLYDVAIVGAGICGLAHALVAARRGKRVVVIDRDAQANGASIRNFGFITVTGQQGGKCWRRAKRSVEVWLEIADSAKIPIVQRGLLTIARRPEARAVIEAFLQTDMGAECRLVEPRELINYGSGLRADEFAGALYSPHEARVESRDAIP